MAEKNGSIKEEVVEGTFNLLGKLVDKWWIVAIAVFIYLLYIGKLDAGVIDYVIDKMGEIVPIVKGLIK